MKNLDNHPLARLKRQLEAAQKRNAERGAKVISKDIKAYHEGVHNGLELAILLADEYLRD